MFNDNLYLILSDLTYVDSTNTIPSGWTSIDVSGYTDVNDFYTESNGFACIAYKNGNDIVIAFRGTDSKRDLVMSDLPIALDLIPSTSYIYAMNFYDAIKNDPLYADCTISLTGHSLGGAIAQLLSASLKSDEGNICNTVTFNAQYYWKNGDKINE